MTSRLSQGNDLQDLKKRLLPLNTYRASFVFLEDLGFSVRYDMFNRLEAVDKTLEECDVSMSSESLYNVMKNKWGFGTLMINGRFQANYGSFHHFVLQTRLYYMNNIGKKYPKHISLEEISSSDSLVKKLVEGKCQL